jgi:aspartate/methionine/tyrosine aminotransferase
LTYLEFVKRSQPARFNLATSGVLGLPLADLPVSLSDLELNGPVGYGYAPLLERLGRLHGVSPDRVVTAGGTGMANALAMGVLLQPGDEVLVEEPAYEPLRHLPERFGARVRRFVRRSEDRYQVNPDEVARKLTARTRLIVLTNLHNPTGAFTDLPTLQAVGRHAARVGARVLVDEVYLDATFDDRRRSACHLGPPFVVTSSLTKVYGLGGLRCGWCLADPDLAARMWRLNDLFENNLAHVAELISVVALDHLPRLAARARTLIAANRAALQAALGGRDDVDWHFPPIGTTAFPRLQGGGALQFCVRLRARHETVATPGDFFERPDCVRLGLGGDPAATQGGLERLVAALDERRTGLTR